jgi:hypothetical protein
VSLAHALTPERAGVVVRPLAGDPMWARQRLIWPATSPAAARAEFRQAAESTGVHR